MCLIAAWYLSGIKIGDYPYVNHLCIAIGAINNKTGKIL